jgi:hypothetical protein
MIMFLNDEKLAFLIKSKGVILPHHEARKADQSRQGVEKDFL